MKKTGLMIALLLATSVGAWADPCAPGFLSGYSTCNIGDREFSKFSYTIGPSTTSGATVFGADMVGVSPLSLSGEPGFVFGVLLLAPAGESATATLRYVIQVTGGGPAIDDASSLFSRIVLGNGVASIMTDLCLGAAWDGSSCSGTVVSLNVFDDGGSGLSHLVDHKTFADTTTIGVKQTIKVDGKNGLAMIGGETTTYSTSPIPEPASLSLLGTGLIGIAGLIRRSLKRK